MAMTLSAVTQTVASVIYGGDTSSAVEATPKVQWPLWLMKESITQEAEQSSNVTLQGARRYTGQPAQFYPEMSRLYGFLEREWAFKLYSEFAA